MGHMFCLDQTSSKRVVPILAMKNPIWDRYPLNTEFLRRMGIAWKRHGRKNTQPSQPMDDDVSQQLQMQMRKTSIVVSLLGAVQHHLSGACNATSHHNSKTNKSNRGKCVEADNHKTKHKQQK